MADRVHLPGGSGGVWRSEDPVHGPVVHRPTGPWSPAVHGVLEHLAHAGLRGIPKLVGMVPGEETLTYLGGRAFEPDIEAPDDALLGAAATWLRGFHDAVAEYRPEGTCTWRGGAAELGPDQIVCHNDPGTYNSIVDGDQFIGLVDWDQAGPGRPLDDVAFLCWTGVPLYRPIGSADAARRVQIVADAYEGVTARDILEAVAPRLARSVERIAAGIDRGDPGMLALSTVGEPARTRARVEEFLGRAPAIRVNLR